MNRASVRLVRITVLGGIGAICPLCIMTSYLITWCVLRFVRSATGDIAAIVIAVLAGTIVIACLPLSRFTRTMVLIVYVPTMTIVIIYSALFVLGVFCGDWL